MSFTVKGIDSITEWCADRPYKDRSFSESFRNTAINGVLFVGLVSCFGRRSGLRHREVEFVFNLCIYFEHASSRSLRNICSNLVSLHGIGIAQSV
jgi:hypothetical protein